MSVIDTLQPVLDAVVADHLDTGTRIVVEGDYLLPSLAVGHPGVRGAIVHEPDVEQLVRNYAIREPDAGRQRIRADVSAALGARLAAQAAAVNVPVITAGR